jgi:hypothetical protein
VGGTATVGGHMLLIAAFEYSAFPLTGWHGFNVTENAFPLNHLS